MKVWDVVKVIADGPHKGKVGVVKSLDSEKKTAMVKLDKVEKAVGFYQDKLTVLAN